MAQVGVAALARSDQSMADDVVKAQVLLESLNSAQPSTDVLHSLVSMIS